MEDGVRFVGPEPGEMAESGEAGLGRLAEPANILGAIEKFFSEVGAVLSERPIAKSDRCCANSDPVPLARMPAGARSSESTRRENGTPVERSAIAASGWKPAFE